MSYDKEKQKFHEFTPEQLRQLDAQKWSDILRDVAELRADLKALKSIFEQAKGAVVFMKWMSALAVAGAAVWAWLSTHFTFK